MTSRLLWQGVLVVCLVAATGAFSEAAQQSELSADDAVRTATQLMKAGNYAAAETVLLNARERLKAGREGQAVPTIEAHLANLWLREGRFQDAERLFREIIPLLGKQHQQAVIAATNGLAQACREQGKYGEAKLLYEGALRLAESNPAWEIHAAAVRNNLALLLMAEGRFAESERLLLRALRVREATYGASSLPVAVILSNLSEVYLSVRNFRAAEKAASRAVEIRARLLPQGHPDTVTSLNNLGSVYVYLREYEQAADVLSRALDAAEPALGSRHPATLAAKSNLAEVLRRQGARERAERLFVEAIEGEQENASPMLPATLQHYAMLLRQTRRKAEARKMEARARMLAGTARSSVDLMELLPLARIEP